MKISFRHGENAIQEVQKEREERAERRKNRLFDFFLPKDGSVVTIRFLTDEPLVFKQHNVKTGENTFERITCTEEFEEGSCKECAKGSDYAQDVGAYLIWDSRPFEVKVRDKNGKETGEKRKVNGSIKPLIRGLTDISLLVKKNQMVGLKSRPFLVFKTGSGKQTKWTFDNGDKDPLTKSMLKEFMETLPENLRNLTPEEVLEKQILPSMETDDAKDKYSDDEKEAVRKQIADEIGEDDDDEPEEKSLPRVKKPLKRRK